MRALEAAQAALAATRAHIAGALDSPLSDIKVTMVLAKWSPGGARPC